MQDPVLQLDQFALQPEQLASEFRYRDPVLRPATLAIVVTQSGETADTLAALRYCQIARA